MIGTAVCPSCRADSKPPAANPFFPFCSERCKLIDLGAWASGSYRIAAANDASDTDTPPEAEDEDTPRS